MARPYIDNNDTGNDGWTDSGNPPLPINKPPLNPPTATLRGTATATIVAVDNATSPRYATIAIQNKTPFESGYIIPPGSGPFAAGGTAGYHFFYNNSSGIGGSLVKVDLDSREILSFTGDVSSSAPTSYYKAITDHLHSGSLNPDGFTNPAPVDLSASQTQNLLPYVQTPLAFQNVITSGGDVLATEFPGSMTLLMSGTYKGMYKQTAAQLTDIRPLTLAVNQWLWMKWNSLSTATQLTGQWGWGPSISDGSGHFYWANSFNNGGGLYRNGTLLTAISANVAYGINVVHSFMFGVQFLGGTSYRVRLLIDGVDVLDYTDASSTLSGSLYPGFFADQANTSYHRDFSFDSNQQPYENLDSRIRNRIASTGGLSVDPGLGAITGFLPFANTDAGIQKLTTGNLIGATVDSTTGRYVIPNTDYGAPTQQTYNLGIGTALIHTLEATFQRTDTTTCIGFELFTDYASGAWNNGYLVQWGGAEGNLVHLYYKSGGAYTGIASAAGPTSDLLSHTIKVVVSQPTAGTLSFSVYVDGAAYLTNSTTTTAFTSGRHALSARSGAATTYVDPNSFSITVGTDAYEETHVAVRQVISSGGTININPPGGVTSTLPYLNTDPNFRNRISVTGGLDVSTTPGAVAGTLPRGNTHTSITNVIDAAGTVDVAVARNILPYVSHAAPFTRNIDANGQNQTTDFQGTYESDPTSADAGFWITPASVAYSWEKTATRFNLAVGSEIFEWSGKGTNNQAGFLINCDTHAANTAPGAGYLVVVDPPNNCARIYKMISGIWTLQATSATNAQYSYLQFAYEHHLKVVVSFTATSSINIWLQFDQITPFIWTDPGTSVNVGYYGLYNNGGTIYTHDFVGKTSLTDAAGAIFSGTNVEQITGNVIAGVDMSKSGHVGGALLDGSSLVRYIKQSAEYQTNFDTSGYFKLSTSLNNKLASTLPITSDMLFNYSAPATGPNAGKFLWWITGANTAGSTPVFNRPDGTPISGVTTTVSITTDNTNTGGNGGLGTSASPYIYNPGTAPLPVYAIAYYNLSTTTWIIRLQSTVPTLSQITTAVSDGVLPIIAGYSTAQLGTTGSGGSGAYTGGKGNIF